MGKQRVVAITAEVGGSLTPGDLQAQPKGWVDDSWMWRDLYGAAASGTSPEVIAERERRRWNSAPAIGDPAVGQTIGEEARPVVDVTLPPGPQ